MSLGPLMLDIEGLQLTRDDAELLTHPQVGGIILFARNYQSPDQLHALITAIRGIRPDIIIAIDQEGGRVQRLKSGFTAIPPMRCLGRLYETAPELALTRATQIGWLIGAEMLAEGIDLSFAPVLDLDSAISDVIGDRAFATCADIVVSLSAAFIDGMHSAGMVATGKHFPGHGGVKADSHVAIPVDQRPLEEIIANDLRPFKQLAGQLDAVMPAHVIYAAVDEQPAGFSRYWLQTVLRQQLAFDGVIFSDDLTMEGASVAGSFAERTRAALDAGCDMVLVCNNRAATLEVLDYLSQSSVIASHRLVRLTGRASMDRESLRQCPQWQRAAEDIAALFDLKT